MVVATPDEGNESKPPLEAFEEVVCFRCNDKVMLTIVLLVECDVKNWIFLIGIDVCE